MQIDKKLLRNCQKGDRKAQYQLFKSCFSVLMGICVRYRSDEQEVQSMVNTGFLKILSNLDTYSDKTPFEAWIRRIMINTLIDDFRKNKNYRQRTTHTDFSEEINTHDLIDYNEADQQFDAEQLTQMIQALPPMSQKVFNLFAIDGYSHKEISEQLGVSEGTSKWHLSTARKQLQAMLRKKGQLPPITKNVDY